MNNKTTSNKTVLAMSVIIAILSVNISVSTVQAAMYEQYGTIAQEDELYTQDNNGLYYINTGANYGIGNGMFEQVNEINDNFTIDAAIKTFGINEDTEQFIYEPILANGQYSNVLFMYELTSFNHFELTHIYEDESGINQELTEMENSD